ncbi:hypothetical protein BD413DRAFT_194716 [Trametes elegans]|nr:hypothetical protein BD413DRAFT_194716 [Trametes elegans]
MGVSTERRPIQPLKRRKIAHSKSPALSPRSLVPTAPANIKVPICTSCHRSFSGAKQSQLVQCARCHETTCTICSRTCNGCPPSTPPTPALTEGSEPSSGPDTPLMSPQLQSRAPSVLGMNMANVQQEEPAPQTLAGRRRKVCDLDQERDDGLREERDGAEGVLPGCGRTVCQKCCFETLSSDLTTCYDCAARYKGSD